MTQETKKPNLKLVETAITEPTLPAQTEEALATRFAKRHENELRYIHARRCWYRYDGKRWQADSTLHARFLLRKLCREAAIQIGDNNIARWRTIDAVEKLSQADPVFAASPEKFDAYRWLLNTPAGTIDLRDGELQQHEPSDHLTKLTTVAPDPDCPILRWRKFLKDVTEGDIELIAFLKRIAGYALTGSTREHALFFLYGTGANGKSVFLNTIAEVLGEYHRTAAMETFLASKYDRHPTELAALAGARLVTATETEEGRRWAEAKIKQLTGGDKIAARGMRQDFFEYTPQFKLLIAGNTKPGLRSVNEAMRRRINLIPFTRVFSENERDLKLAEKLKRERPGILHWMIEGCREWQQNGLRPPHSVRAASNAYFQAEDVIGAFLNECCEIDPNETHSSRWLFDEWKKYAQARGEYFGTHKAFSSALIERGFQTKRQATGMVFLGLTVKEERPRG